jgi:hypothetical protein
MLGRVGSAGSPPPPARLRSRSFDLPVRVLAPAGGSKSESVAAQEINKDEEATQ